MIDFKNIKGILFDLDGTLIDSVNETTEILNKMRKKRGKLPLTRDRYEKLISHGAGELVRCACEDDKQSQEELVDEFRKYYKAIKTPKESIYPNVEETLLKLKQAGLKLAICTNKPKNLCDQVLQDTCLTPFFDCVTAGGMTKESKPSREPVDYAISCLNLTSEQVLLVGDSTVDQRAAKAAEIPFVFFSTGYDDGVNAVYHVSISEMSQLLKFIKLK